MKFERHHKWKTILFVLLRNALPLAFFLYGLKCIVMLHGKLTEPHDLSTPHMLGSFKIVSVTGTTAALTGLGYIAGGLFFYLSVSLPSDESRTWLWRIGREIIRWGSFIAVFVFWHEAHKLRIGA